MVSLALNMILKDEEENLKSNNYESVFSFFDEVVVVDTGSSDKTAELCKNWGAKVIESQWINDFAHSRNIAKNNTLSHYIMWLDGDDKIEEEDIIFVRKIIKENPNSIFLLRLFNANSENDEIIYQRRVFPNKNDIEFKGAVHEHLAYSKKKYNSYKTDEAVVLHKGYDSPENIEKKLERNTNILVSAVESGNSNFLYYYYLANTFLYKKKNVQKSDFYIKKIIDDKVAKSDEDNIYPYALFVKSDIEKFKGNVEIAIKYMQKAINLVSGEVNFHHSLGFLYFLKEDYKTAYDIFDKVYNFKDFSPKGFLPVAVNKIKSEALYYKTVSSFYLNDLTKTIKDGQDFLKTKLAKTDFMVPLFLAKTWFRKKNYIKAKYYYKLSENNLIKYPDWQHFFENSNNKNFDKLEVIKKRLSKDKFDFLALYHLGVLYEEKNDPQAKEFYLKAFEINPLYENARRSILRFDTNNNQHILSIMKLLALK